MFNILLSFYEIEKLETGGPALARRGEREQLLISSEKLSFVAIDEVHSPLGLYNSV
jgi:hypothetical protein